MKFLTTFFTILTAAVIASAAVYIPFDGTTHNETLAVQSYNSTVSGVDMNFSAEGILSVTSSEAGYNYTRLSWDNSGVEGNIGQPEMPVYRFFLEIPFGASISIVTESQNQIEYTLSELGLSTIRPVQPPLEKIKGAHNDFQIDRNYYAGGYSGKPAVEVEEYFRLRERQIASVIVRPVDYNPEQGTILVRDNLSVRFNFQGGDMARTARNIARFGDPYHNRIVDGMVSNPGVFQTDALPSPVVYLVVSADNQNWLDAIQPLLDWKTSKGYEVHLATTTETGTTANAIRSYISNAYNNWDNPPVYVLLIGDVAQIPNFTGQGAGNPATDLYYGDMDNVYQTSEIWVGRFSPSSTAELTNMVAKTLNVEQVLWTGNDDWEKHAVFMASNDNYTVSEGTHNFVIHTYLEPLEYISDRLYCHTYGATTAQTTAAFNQGRMQGTYSGHGSTTSWADGPVFTQNNVRALTNTVYPFVQSYACQTGDYTVAECFAETWLRAANGAVGFMGSSVNSYWDEDDLLERELYEGFYNNQAPADSVNFTWIGGMMTYGKTGLYQFYGNTGTVRRYFEMYNIMGDPSVDVWTNIPLTVVVQHPPVVYLGTSQASVTVTGAPQWALVCAHSDVEDGVWASGYTNGAGMVTLQFDTPPSLPGNMIFTVTGHDIDPYIGTVPLTPASGPYVVFNACTINDASAWNPNQAIDYDETVNLNMTLQNVGVQSASNVTAVIRSTDPAVSIIDSTAVFGNIAANTSVLINNAFQIYLSPSVEDGYIIPFQVVAASGAQSWTTPFSITSHAADVVLQQVTIIDNPPGGNGNQALDPGESAVMQLYLINEGSSPALSVDAAISTIDPYITLGTTGAAFGSLLPGTPVSQDFNLTVSPSCPQDHNVDLQCSLNGSHSFTSLIQFFLTVGNIQYLPTGPDLYGYSAYDIHDAPVFPDYDWIEINPEIGGPGQEIVYTSDDQTFRYDLPFTFRYYGQDYTRVSICNNGWIAMGETNSTDYSNSGVPNNDGPPAMIAPFWDDLSPQVAGTVAQYYDSTDHIYVVEFYQVRQYNPTTAFETFEIILYDPAFFPGPDGNGKIKFQYGHITDPSSCTIGIENAAQNDGLQYLYDGNYDLHASLVDSGMAILFFASNEIPSMDITLTPASLPIIIPSVGGSFSYLLNIQNLGTTPASFDAWLEAQLPNGSYYPILTRTGLTLGGGASLSRNMTQNVPGSAPGGNYVFAGFVGQHPSVIYDNSVFPFTKIGADLNSGHGEWTTSGWDGDFVSTIPEKFSLSQNYPNPFNPETSFDFDIPSLTQVDIRVYDISGRETAVLLAGITPPGSYTLKWDASRNSAGVYFIRMEAGDYTRTIKAVLVK